MKRRDEAVAARRVRAARRWRRFWQQNFAAAMFTILASHYAPSLAVLLAWIGGYMGVFIVAILIDLALCYRADYWEPIQ